ncbi:hypothetical protein [Neorhizobium galegae]|uniref:hypothetical protein n=1 Tax=Neorhizobium galegae TaxID=399 RepID=UPI0006221678|nr:hypothetical protein [Neorhizobium galegae]MCQ1835951.1 hypothetical protein [Neorhizobium galegae]UIK04015.1 hypothetical protein LZK81_15080 [Neorhizobium galegae]UIY28492.1 hypothetical protein LZK73_16755 [Neorhizobium galegae]CDZ60819.1 Hypothetical protein NGAL_HAMBI2605_12130 [Neorhizobium galegae bv. orientalis]
MDIYSLAITHIHTQAQPVRMSAWAEDRYYSDQMALTRLSLGLLGSIAMTAGMFLILCTTLI